MTEQVMRKQRIRISAGPVKVESTDLIRSLCDALNQHGVRYCHWKSNANIEKFLSGDGDLDLLIHRQDVQKFNQIMAGLGFKEAEVPEGRRIPGIRDYFGYDPRLQEFVHVHAHFQLTVGHDATKRIHLCIEEEYLNSVSQQGLIKVPTADFEYIVLILRLVFKHFNWDAWLRLESHLSRNERHELDWLKKKVSPQKVNEILAVNFPTVNPEDFHRFEQSLDEGKMGVKPVRIGQRLADQLEVYSRMNHWKSRWIEFTYRIGEAYRRRIIKESIGKTFASGGLFIAVVGGDGSGKTTLINALYPWLNRVFETMKIHLGKPKWSRMTILIRAFLKIFRLMGSQPFLQAPLVYTNDQEQIKFPGYPWAVREVCTARDRFLTYRKAQKFATNGGIVISDRFPLMDIHFMDGPQIERMYGNQKRTRLIRWLIEKENSYYRFICRPDLMIVLKVDPKIAARRKAEEDRENVMARTREIWTLDWSKLNVHEIDAGLPQEAVLGKVKELIWSYL